MWTFWKEKQKNFWGWGVIGCEIFIPLLNVISLESVVKQWVAPSNIVDFLDSLYVRDVLWGMVEYWASKLYLDLYSL